MLVPKFWGLKSYRQSAIWPSPWSEKKGIISIPKLLMRWDFVSWASMADNLGSGVAPFISGKRGQAFHEIRNFKNCCFAPLHQLFCLFSLLASLSCHLGLSVRTHFLGRCPSLQDNPIRPHRAVICPKDSSTDVSSWKRNDKNKEETTALLNMK